MNELAEVLSGFTEILHELIDAAQRTLSPNRVGELHALADKAAAVTAPEPEAQVAAPSPLTRAERIAQLEAELGDLHALEAAATPGTEPDGTPAAQ
jgi:hypothetical protein